jgi:hypothetical protein
MTTAPWPAHWKLENPQFKALKTKEKHEKEEGRMTISPKQRKEAREEQQTPPMEGSEA